MYTDDPTPHLERFDSYAQACREFRWQIPRRFNIATALCRKHPDAITRVALTEVKEGGTNTYTFGALDFLSDKFATALFQSGVAQHDLVAVILPQSAALAVAHLGALKVGAVVVPLAICTDFSSLRDALVNSNFKAAVVHESMQRIAEESRNVPGLESCFVVRDLRPSAASSVTDFWTEVDQASSDFDNVETDANSPAFILYSSLGGELTGAVHCHASLIGQLTSFEMFNNLEVEANGIFWTPDDWSSAKQIGLLYPAWWYGCSVVAGTARDSAGALQLIERHEVTHAFTTSSQLKALAETESRQSERFDLKLRAIVNDGALSVELREAATQALGSPINEVRGKPETGWIIGGCQRWFSPRPGSAGRATPGRSIEIIDENGSLVAPGRIGLVAVHRSDPALFSGYYDAPERTAASFNGDWFLTGASGHKNEDGDLYLSPSLPEGGEH